MAERVNNSVVTDKQGNPITELDWVVRDEEEDVHNPEKTNGVLLTIDKDWWTNFKDLSAQERLAFTLLFDEGVSSKRVAREMGIGGARLLQLLDNAITRYTALVVQQRLVDWATLNLERNKS